MKKISIIAIALLFSFLFAKAQILKPVKWSFASKRLSPTEGVVFFKATIEDGWHIYSQHVKPGGPVKTSFNFTDSKEYTLVGTTSEPVAQTKYESAFGMDVSYFEHTVIFQQKIKLNIAQTTLKGSLEYMTCNDRQCLPPGDIDFSIEIK